MLELLKLAHPGAGSCFLGLESRLDICELVERRAVHRLLDHLQNGPHEVLVAFEVAPAIGQRISEVILRWAPREPAIARWFMSRDGSLPLLSCSARYSSA